VDISGNGNTPTHVSDSLNLAHQWQWFVAVSGHPSINEHISRVRCLIKEQ
jgi:hypothetical protein